MRHALVLAAASFSLAAVPLSAQGTFGTGLSSAIGPFTKAAPGFQTLGQSFMAPGVVVRLQSFSLSFTNFFNGAALRFDAYLYAFDVANRRLSGNALWSSTNVAGSGNDFDFDLRTFATGNVRLAPSTIYMFLITTSTQGSTVPDDAANQVGISTGNAYTGGTLWIAENGSNPGRLLDSNAFTDVGSADGLDAAFSATFAVDEQVVPEPTTLLLTGAGLIGLVITARRRRMTAR